MAAKKKTKAHVSDEYFSLTEEIVKEAYVEVLAELMRRGLDAKMTKATAGIVFFTRGVAIMQQLNDEIGGEHYSKEALHMRLDQTWEALRAPTDVDDKVH